MSKAVIGKPAPAFTAQAIVDGEIKEISLSDYMGASLCVSPPIKAKPESWGERRSPSLDASTRLHTNSRGSRYRSSPSRVRLALLRDSAREIRPKRAAAADDAGARRAPRAARARHYKSIAHPLLLLPPLPTTHSQASTSSSSSTPWTGPLSGESGFSPLPPNTLLPPFPSPRSPARRLAAGGPPPPPRSPSFLSLSHTHPELTPKTQQRDTHALQPKTHAALPRSSPSATAQRSLRRSAPRWSAAASTRTSRTSPGSTLRASRAVWGAAPSRSWPT